MLKLLAMALTTSMHGLQISVLILQSVLFSTVVVANAEFSIHIFGRYNNKCFAERSV